MLLYHAELASQRAGRKTFLEARAGWQLRCSQAIAPCRVGRTQCSAACCVLKPGQAYGNSFGIAMPKSACIASAELVGPGVKFTCEMLYQKLHVMLCCPSCCELEKRAQRFCSAPELFCLCFCSRVVSGCRKAEGPMLCSQCAVRCHCESQLCERFGASYVALRRVCQLRPDRTDF